MCVHAIVVIKHMTMSCVDAEEHVAVAEADPTEFKLLLYQNQCSSHLYTFFYMNFI